VDKQSKQDDIKTNFNEIKAIEDREHILFQERINKFWQKREQTITEVD